MIPYGRQSISEEDIEAVVSVLRSDYLTQGPMVQQFEKVICDYTGAQFGVATNSATSALHIACLALDVGPGDLVWTTPITFVASANCARYCGADVDFVDVDPGSINMSPESLKKKLEQVCRNGGRLPKVVIPVHFAGQPCEMDEIYNLSKEYNFQIIEDAAHAIGAHYQGNPVGSNQYSDITVFSFHPVKVITAGEGGMAVTNNKELAEKMGRLRSHGITRDKNKMTNEPDGSWCYQQIELGYNYRMSDIHAALGISQLSRLEQFLERRRELVRQYDAAFKDVAVGTQLQLCDAESANHLYVVRVQPSKHQDIFENLRSQGIGVNLHYIPVYHQPDFQRLGFKHGYCPEAEQYYHEAITLPLYPSMSNRQQRQIIFALDRLVSL